MEAELIKIKDIIENKYSINNFVNLVKELFPNMQVVAPDKFNTEYSNFSSYVEGYIHIGDYITPDNKKILIASIQLKNAQYVENSRTAQRNYAKRLIENNGYEAAFVAFYTEPLNKQELKEKDGKWRISFVKIDYSVNFDNGKLKANKSLTPAKRYSYLVGKGEPSHTAIERIREIIEKHKKPKLIDLENAFSVEKVTDEFFEAYTEKFNDLNDYLSNNDDFKYEANRLGLNPEDFSIQFSKKLLGQIVFLYFLQKKGWLGVNAWPSTITEKEFKHAYYDFDKKITKTFIPKLYIKDNEKEDTYKLNTKEFENPQMSSDDEAYLSTTVQASIWGSGPRDFMRKYYEYSVRQDDDKTFFDDYLEPLFYDALNKNRGEQGYWPYFHCRIPFLSGSLFEPINNYDWQHSEFKIPNMMFSNKKSENDPNGTGILDIFDRYNFTISEDEPMEKEVAIDPEMLGKVFESMLDVKDRKANGEFYTPREIVHYMCQESLINYLNTKTGISYEAIKDFILYGEFIKGEDTNKNNNDNLLISEEIYKEDKNGKVIVNRLKKIDNLLANIKVADPAVGSGAFPLGMVNEIVKARETITDYIYKYENAYNKRLIYTIDRSTHKLKLETIKNSIFAVDLEPSATDITKLRLWLSLVIDDEINPNAHDEFEGHRNPLPLPNLECNVLCGNSLMDEYKGIKLLEPQSILGMNAYGETVSLFEDTLKVLINKLLETQDKLFICTNTDDKLKLKAEIEDIKLEIIKTQLSNFGANVNILDELKKIKYTTQKPFIIWQLDFARVFRDNQGFDVVIGNPPYFLYQASHKGEIEELRNIEILKSAFGGKLNAYKLFLAKALHSLVRKDGVVCYIFQNSFMADKQALELRKDVFNNYQLLKIDSYPERDNVHKRVFKSVKMSVCIVQIKNSKEDLPFVVNIWDDKYKSSGISTEFTKKDIESIDTESLLIPRLKQEFLPVVVKINSLNDVFHIKCFEGELNMTFHKSYFIENNTSPKVLKGASIQRYYWTENMSQGKIDYLNEEKYLSDFVRSEKSRHHFNDRIALQGMTGANDKIRIVATIVPKGVYLANSCNYILQVKEIDLRYILGILNSKLVNWYFRCFSTNSNVNGYEIDNVPFKYSSEEEYNKLITLVDKILKAKEGQPNSNTLEVEKEIDDLVYKIYELSDDQIHIIEKN